MKTSETSSFPRRFFCLRVVASWVILPALLLCNSALASFQSVGSFVGDKSETWEGFSAGTPVPNGQSILSGYAKISSFSGSGGAMRIYDLGANSFDLEYSPNSKANVSDGIRGLGLEGTGRQTTIAFDNGPVYGFGSYWTVGNQGVSFIATKSWTVELFFEGGATSGAMSLDYDAAVVGDFVSLGWFGWRSSAAITKVIITGNYVAMDGLQVETVPVPEPSTFIAGALLALPFGFQGLRYLRNRKRG